MELTLDFVPDSTYTGRRFRTLAIVDDFSRECAAIEVDSSIGDKRVASALARLMQTMGLPEIITMDNVPQFTLSKKHAKKTGHIYQLSKQVME